MADGSIDIDVRLNGAPAEAQAAAIGQSVGRQVSAAVDSAAQSAKSSTNRAIGEIGGALTAFGSAYSKAVTLPIAAAAVASGASAVKIDTALTGVRKTVDGTEQQYEALKDAAIEFSKTNAVDPAQILDIQALGAQLGYSIDELDEFGEVVSGLDIATNMNAEEAATQLAQFANIMGMSHDETRNFGSTIVDLGNNFATTEADIANMAMRIAGAGKQIGMSEADVLGLATALSSMGINAEAGGSAISTIMSRIDKDVALGTDSLELWASTANMSVDEFSRAWGEDAVGALSAVLVGMDAATQQGGNMAVMLDELGIQEIRQTDTLKRLASNSEFLGKAVDTANTAWEENVALDKEVENRNNSMAAQLQILWNRIQAAAIEVGSALVPALIDIIDIANPLIDALASGAKAFGDLDEGGQKAVLLAVAIVAGFGPMVGLIGKITTGVQNSAGTWKTFSENLRTVKTNLAASTAEISRQTAAQSKYRTVMIGGQQATVRYNAATKQMTVVQSATTNATKAQTAAMKASAVASNASTVAMKAASVAGRALSTALKTIAPIAALTVGIELFTALSGAIQGSAEKAKLHEDATRGLEDAASGLNVQLNAEGDAFESLAGSAETVDLKGMAKQHRDLASSISETSQSAIDSQGILTQYGDAIQSLAGRSDLTEQEVARLKIAVDGVNQSLGTNYSVVQDSAGAYQIMSDGAVVAKDSVYSLIEAQKAQIRAQAEAENYKAVYQQMAKDQEALATATRNATAAEEAMNAKIQQLGESRYAVNQATGETIDLAQSEVDAYNDAQNALSEVESQAGATQSSLNRLEEQQVLTSMAMEDTADAVIKAADANAAYKAAVQGVGVNLVDFTNALKDAGFTAEQVAGLTSEQAMEMAKGWQGGTESLIEATEQAGIEVPEKLRQMGKQASAATNESGHAAGQGFTSGLSAETQATIDAALNTVGMTRAEFDKLAAQAGIEGDEAALAFVQEIAAGEGDSRSAGQLNATVALEGFGSQDSTPQGAELADEFSGAIYGGTSDSEVAGRSNANASITGFGSRNATPQGNSLRSQFSSAVGRDTWKSKDAASKQANAAGEGFQSQNGNAYGWGSHLSQNFASGIRAGAGAVRSAANACAAIAKSVLGHSVPKEGPLREGGKGEAVWGEHLVQNLIDGMLSKRADLKSATKLLAQDINDDLMADLAGDPMRQLTESITRGSAALNMSAMMVGAAPSYTTNNQNLSFYGEYSSPDIIARNMRMQQHYGLAGGNI